MCLCRFLSSEFNPGLIGQSAKETSSLLTVAIKTFHTGKQEQPSPTEMGGEKDPQCHITLQPHISRGSRFWMAAKSNIKVLFSFYDPERHTVNNSRAGLF